MMYGSDNSRSPNQSPGSESENGGKKGEGEGSSGKEPAEVERRSSSINALRVKAREHELKLGLGTRIPSEDIVIT